MKKCVYFLTFENSLVSFVNNVKLTSRSSCSTQRKIFITK